MGSSCSYVHAFNHPGWDVIADRSRKPTFKAEKRITCAAAFNWSDQCRCPETMSASMSVFMRLFRLHGARTFRWWERRGLCAHELRGEWHICVCLPFCHLNANGWFLLFEQAQIQITTSLQSHSQDLKSIFALCPTDARGYVSRGIVDPVALLIMLER